MNLHETAKMLTTLREFYPQGQPITETTVKAWHLVFDDIDFQVAMSVIPEVVKEWDGYTMPPPAAIIKKIKSASAGDTAIELWNEADKLISRGTILTIEEFEQADPTIKTYFGSVSRIRELALMDAAQTANERARFLKQAPQIREKIETRKALPAEVLAMIDGVAARKQLQ